MIKKKREGGLPIPEGKSLCKTIQMKTAIVVKCEVVDLAIRNNKVALFLTMLNWLWMM